MMRICSSHPLVIVIYLLYFYDRFRAAAARRRARLSRQIPPQDAGHRRRQRSASVRRRRRQSAAARIGSDCADRRATDADQQAMQYGDDFIYAKWVCNFIVFGFVTGPEYRACLGALNKSLGAGEVSEFVAATEEAMRQCSFTLKKVDKKKDR